MVELKVPSLGESITTAFLGTWSQAPGSEVRAGQVLVAVDSDKATLEVPSPVSGRLLKLLREPGDEVRVGEVIAWIEEGEVVASPAAEAAVEPAAAEKPDDRPPRAGPAARQAAHEAGVDLREVEGTGARGRVLARDVHAHGRREAEPAPVGAPPAAPGVPPQGATSRVPMTPLRRTIARRLVQAQQTAAMLTTFNEVDLSQVMALRARHQEAFVKRHGLKLGLMSFFVKAVVGALSEFPELNAEIDEADPDRPVVVYKHFVHMGVAVSTERGLLVPVLRDADRLSFAEIERGIAELAERGRQGKLGPDDFREGSFTISNGGVFGSLLSTPILNHPQVGILGMHTIQERPVGVDGQIVLRPMMYVALSYDHRIIDGRQAVGFLKRVKELVEQPERLLIEA